MANAHDLSYADKLKLRQARKIDRQVETLVLIPTEMQTAEVEVAAILAEKKMVLGDILSLNVGEIIPIEVQDPITAFVNRVPMIRGKYGVKNGRYALRVEEIRNPTDFVSLGLKNRQLLGPQKYDDEFKFGMEK